MASRSFHAQKNRAEMYVRELIETDDDALATYEVDPLSSGYKEDEEEVEQDIDRAPT